METPVFNEGSVVHIAGEEYLVREKSNNDTYILTSVYVKNIGGYLTNQFVARVIPKLTIIGSER